MINLVFDYDGTLHDSLKIYAPAFRKCCEKLHENEKAQYKTYTDDEIKKWIGMDVKTMWEEFMPSLSQEKKNFYSNFIGEEMLKNINEGKAELYEGALELLDSLKKDGYRLIFLSNCKKSYMESHIKMFSLDKYFEDFYCTEDHDFIPKHKVFEAIKSKYGGDFIVIGDRFSDMEIAIKHKIKSIGCVYGYGNEEEIERANFKAANISEIIKYIKE